MKRIFYIAIFAILLAVPLASAADWDNVKSYNPERQEITIDNALGFGSKIASIRLLTPHDNLVMPGKDRLVAELQFDVNAEHVPYNQMFKGMELYNKREGNKPFAREFQYKYKTKIGERTYPIIDTICPDANRDNCYTKVLETKTENIYSWTTINKNTDMSDLPSKNLTIGIFTDVLSGDKVEWVPIWFGIRIPEYAAWTSALNNNLLLYLKLNETSGTNALDSLSGIYNGTSSSVTLGSPGIIGNGYFLDTTTDYIDLNKTVFNNTADSLTISLWVNLTDATINKNIWQAQLDGNREFLFRTLNSSSYQWYIYSDPPAAAFQFRFFPTYTLNTWEHYVLTLTNASGQQQANMYKNGVLIAQDNTTVFMPYVPTNHRLGNGNGGQGSLFMIDEFAYWNVNLTGSQVSDLYNGGTGITYTNSFAGASPNITINSPASANYTTTPQSIAFNFTGVDDTNVTNITLVINNAINFTKLDGSSNSSELYTTLSMGEGWYNISGYVTDAANNVVWAVDNRTIIIDATAPTLSLDHPANSSIYDYLTGVSINYTASDAISGIGTCWRSLDDGTNITISSCSNSSFNTIVGDHYLRSYANDTLGNLRTTITNFTVVNTSVSRTFPSNSIINTNQTFQISINKSGNVKVVPRFFLNNTLYTTGFVNTSTDYNFSGIMPTITNLTENKTFYWSWNLSYNINSGIFNTTERNVSISRFAIGLCNATYTQPTLNFTIKDENNFTSLNGTRQESLFSVWNDAIGQGNALNFSFNQTGSSPILDAYSYCLYPADASFYMDSLLSTSKTGYDTREYWYENHSLTNTTQNISIYLLDAPTSTINLLTVQDEYQTGVEGALVSIQKLDIANNEYKTLQVIKTDSNGQAVLRLQWYDIFYRFIVVNDGATKLVSVPAKVAEEAITLSLSPEFTFLHDAFNNVDWSLLWVNSTKLFQLTYNSLSSSKTVCLRVEKLSLQNFTTLCDSCSTASTDTISCNITSYGDGTYVASGYGKGSSWYFGSISQVVKTAADKVAYNLGTVIAIGFAGTLALIGALLHPAFAIIGLLLGLAAMPILGIRSFDVTVFTGLTIIALMIIWRMQK